jgi:hypothetical protein
VRGAFPAGAQRQPSQIYTWGGDALYSAEVNGMTADKCDQPLGTTYEPGKPEGPENWRAKLTSRQDMLMYLETGERYWYSKEVYGSERRRDPA